MGYTLDGVNAKAPVESNPNGLDDVMTSSLDAIQEFKLWTTGLPAEVGHGSGGQLAGVFKSGTNQFHGSMEDRYLNVNLFHRGYFDQLDHSREFTYHEMGATAGGPIIPNKTFFFWGFQRHHEKDTDTFIGDVPSSEMLNGDFSFNGLGLPIYDPASTTQDAKGNWIRTQFPNNQVPLNRFDPVAKAVLANQPWREPNDPGTMTANGPEGNLVRNNKGRFFFTRFDHKIDHQFNAYHKIFGRYSHNRIRNGVFSDLIQWPLATAPVTTPTDFGNLVISYNYTISPTSINEMRFGGNRRFFTRLPESYGEDWAGQLGIPNVPVNTFPAFYATSSEMLYGIGPGSKEQQVAEDLTFQNNFTKIIGRHTMKLGYEYIRTRYNAEPQALPSGRYNLGGTEFPFTPNTGNAFASFLLGSVGSAVFTENTATWLPRWTSQAWYVQTDYKPARNITLNLGVRWQYESPLHTKYGQQSQFDPAAVDPVTGRRGAIVHSKDALAKKDWNNFQPRLGFAWQFRPETVFRASFGMLSSDIWAINRPQNFQEYLATANIQAPPGDPRPAFYLSQGPPDRNFNIAADGSVPFIGQNFSAREADWYDPNMRLPYVMNWSAGFQHQLGGTWMAEVLYQASSGVGQINYWNINVLPPDIAGDFATLDLIRRQYQNYRPYPQFGTINHYSNYGHSSYHGLTLRLEKRYSSGLTINAFYTKSKTLNEDSDDSSASGITWYNRTLEKGRSDNDIAHRFVGSVIWDIPVGRGRRYLNSGGFVNAVLGGWEFVWVQTLQTGTPFTVGFAGSPNRYLPNIGSRPHQVLPNEQAKEDHVDIGPDRFPRSAQNRYLHLEAFRYPDSFTIGSLGRNTLTGPGIIWAQASLSKSWSILERLKFSLRLDWNNALKVPGFSNPDSTFNATNPANFGTFSGGRGSFSDVGTHRSHGIMVFRLEW
jgi:hypothetical protein